MHIVLLILKIIGIILLLLLLLVLAILLIVLCTPVRYRIQGGYADEKPDVNVRVGIWFSLIAAHATFNEEGLAVFLKIFGVKKYIIRPKPKAEESEENENLLSMEDGPAEFEDESGGEIEFEDDFEPDDVEEAGEDEYDVSLPEDSKASDAEGADETDEAPKTDTLKTDTVAEESEKKSLQDKVMSVVDKLKGLYSKISETVEKLKSLYHSLKRKEDAVMWFLKLKSTKHTIALLKTQLIKVMKSVLPKKLTGELKLGLDDPATMGQICMYAGIFYPMYDKHFKFTPEFSEKVIDGEVYVKGRIILGAILAHFAKLLVVPDFYRTLKNVKILMRRIK